MFLFSPKYVLMCRNIDNKLVFSMSFLNLFLYELILFLDFRNMFLLGTCPCWKKDEKKRGRRDVPLINMINIF